MQKSQIQPWVAQHPLLQRMVALEPITWFNPRATTLAAGLPHVGLTAADVAAAEQRLS
ncbi:D-serine dehydratase, partial [Serratia nevei]|nr:D-serine dehydratase [Serratia nevei]